MHQAPYYGLWGMKNAKCEKMKSEPVIKNSLSAPFSFLSFIDGCESSTNPASVGGSEK